MENNNNNNKRIDELSMDELMKVAQKPIKKPKKSSKKLDTVEKIKQFVVSENIKSHANVCVPTIVVYDRFVKWCDANGENPLTAMSFSKEFNKLFKRRLVNNVSHYLLHPEGFALNDYEVFKKKYTSNKKGQA